MGRGVDVEEDEGGREIGRQAAYVCSMTVRMRKPAAVFPSTFSSPASLGPGKVNSWSERLSV